MAVCICVGLPNCESGSLTIEDASGGQGGERMKGPGGSSPRPPTSGGDSSMDSLTSGGLAPAGGALLLAGGAAGATGQAGSQGEEPEAPVFECRRPIGAALADHACLHARFGPFLTVAAPESVEGAPLLTQPHTAYEFTSPLAYGWVGYRAAESGHFAVFLSQGVTLFRILPENVPHLEALGAGSCDLFGEVLAFSALAGQEIWLELSPPGLVVFEAMSAFGENAWSGVCGCSLPGESCGEGCCEGACSDGTCPDSGVPMTCAPGLRDDGEACSEDSECCSGECDMVCVRERSCRSSGPCQSDDECCLYCHDQDHCH